MLIRDRSDDPLTYHGPPLLVIEIVSDHRRDLRIKRDRYERFGVPEYWAVLPEADQVQVFRTVDGRYGPPTVYEPPATVSALAVPSLKIDLTVLFRD